MEKKQVNSEIEVTLSLIGGKYKPLILYYLYEEGTQRFSRLQEHMPSISQRTLTNQLRELERDGLLVRRVYAQVPPKVEYSLTAEGESLFPLLDLMCTWGAQHNHGRFSLLHPQCTKEDSDDAHSY
ncbi:MAG: winged helix-turn-helix transcriptional regulator [Erysipelotrichaceae bacterium]